MLLAFKDIIKDAIQKKSNNFQLSEQYISVDAIEEDSRQNKGYGLFFPNEP